MSDLAIMTDAFIPSVLLSETHFACRQAKGVIADAVARVVDEGFYRSVEISDVSNAADRKRIGDIVRKNKLHLTQWMSMILSEEKLSLSSLDEDARLQSVARMKELIKDASECGAACFAVLSGPDPGPLLRRKATERLFVSFCELCRLLKPFSMDIVLEPLDRDAHKNGLLGPAAEYVPFIEQVQSKHPNVGISWDSAHAALCGEDVLESLEMTHPYVQEIHLANAVLDRESPQFGDNHMPVGGEGFLNIEKIAELFECADKKGLFFKRRPCVAVEIRTPGGGDPWQTEALGRKILQEAWSEYLTRRGSR